MRGIKPPVLVLVLTMTSMACSNTPAAEISLGTELESKADSGIVISHAGALETGFRSPSSSIIRAVPIHIFDRIDVVAEELSLDVDYDQLDNPVFQSDYVPILLELSEQLHTNLPVDVEDYLIISAPDIELVSDVSVSVGNPTAVTFPVVENQEGIAVVKALTEAEANMVWTQVMEAFSEFLVSDGYGGEYPFSPDLTAEEYPNGIVHMMLMRWWGIESSFGEECVVVSESECVDLDTFLAVLE